MLSPLPVILTGAMRLIDERTADGSRRFSRLSCAADWDGIRGHVMQLSGAETINFTNEESGIRRLDFSFRGRRFLIHRQDGRIHLYVDDPQCSDLILFQVCRHFEQLLR
ncbi:MAG: hypothetical protein JW959_03520 [Pirellulales bacterium]|nr:hypothetical protein [Pirellulales bacterium]